MNVDKRLRNIMNEDQIESKAYLRWIEYKIGNLSDQPRDIDICEYIHDGTALLKLIKVLFVVRLNHNICYLLINKILSSKISGSSTR